MKAENKLKLARAKAKKPELSLGVFDSAEIEELHAKLNNLYTVVGKLVDNIDTKAELEAQEKQLVEVNNSLVGLISKFEQGIDVKNFDQIKQQAEIVVKDMPRNIIVDNQVKIPDWLAKDESIKDLHKQIISLVQQVNKAVEPRLPGQSVGDFIPFRRVRFDGMRLVFDDKTWSTGGGGGGTSGGSSATATGLLPFPFDDIQFSNADGNGNYQTGIVKNGGATVATLSLTYDGNSNITGITRT